LLARPDATPVDDAGRGVPAVVVIVTVDVFADASVILTVAGLNAAPAPVGRPVAERLTAPVNPANGVIVTTYCAVVPGVPGMSETIRVRSVLGRFLEHSRALVLENAGGQSYGIWVSPADPNTVIVGVFVIRTKVCDVVDAGNEVKKICAARG